MHRSLPRSPPLERGTGRFLRVSCGSPGFFFAPASWISIPPCIAIVVDAPQLHRNRIGRALDFGGSVESSGGSLQNSVMDKCRRISLCLAKLDNRLVATNLNHMLWADMVRHGAWTVVFRRSWVSCVGGRRPEGSI